MPIFAINDKQLGVYQLTGYKRYGIYLFEKPNIWYKVASFSNDESTERFIEYLDAMFNGLMKRTRAEAVPIEWIGKQIEQYYDDGYNSYGKALSIMLADWRAENE